MAWFYGTYACGHEGRVQIYGKVRDRQWKADREFSKLCPECWEKELQKRREQENAEAAAKAAEMGLPELTGTPKQVAWANTLRQRLIDTYEEFFDRERRKQRYNEKYGVNMDEVLEFILKNHTEASYYIDHRGWTLLEIIEENIKKMR